MMYLKGGHSMTISEVEVKKLNSNETPCGKHSIRVAAVVEYNGIPCCGECFANELLDTPDGRSILGNVLAGLVKA